MSKVLDNLKKRRGSPVTIDDDTFYVRALTIGELRRVDELTAEDSTLKTGFTIGCALCAGDSGEPEIPKQPDESDKQWAARVLEALADVPSSTIRQLSEGVGSIGKSPKLETVVKN